MESRFHKASGTADFEPSVPSSSSRSFSIIYNDLTAPWLGVEYSRDVPNTPSLAPIQPLFFDWLRSLRACSWKRRSAGTSGWAPATLDPFLRGRFGLERASLPWPVFLSRGEAPQSSDRRDRTFNPPVNSLKTLEKRAVRNSHKIPPLSQLRGFRMNDLVDSKETCREVPRGAVGCGRTR
jgi:hypothetical protein